MGLHYGTDFFKVHRVYLSIKRK